MPLAISAFTVGFVFGVLARQAKLSVVQSLLMSAFVFAGASQFVALTLWIVTPLPVITIILTTFIVNLRHVLMGASPRPWFARLAPSKVYTSVFFMVHESWALAISDFAAGGRDGAFWPGSGLMMVVACVGFPRVVQTVGGSIPNPARAGAAFAFQGVVYGLRVGLSDMMT